MNKIVTSMDETIEAMATSLNGEKPVFWSRIGGTETEIAHLYHMRRQQGKNLDNALSCDTGFMNAVKIIKGCAGYYDKENKINNVVKFIEIYLSAMGNADYINAAGSKWLDVYDFLPIGNKYYGQAKNLRQVLRKFLNEINNTAEVHSYRVIDLITPFLGLLPRLVDRKILIVSAFVDSFKIQRDNLKKLFKDYTYPELNMVYYKSPITYNYDNNKIFDLPHNNWIETFEAMCNDIKDIDFDIALLSCGSYAVPLGSFIKSIGRKAMNCGGILSVIFGVLGKRWDDCSYYSNILNKGHFIKPVEYNLSAKNKNNINEPLWSYF